MKINYKEVEVDISTDEFTSLADGNYLEYLISTMILVNQEVLDENSIAQVSIDDFEEDDIEKQRINNIFKNIKGLDNDEDF